MAKLSKNRLIINFFMFYLGYQIIFALINGKTLLKVFSLH